MVGMEMHFGNFTPKNPISEFLEAEDDPNGSWSNGTRDRLGAGAA